MEDYAALTHVDLLKHRSIEEHPENPERLSSILSLFQPGSPFNFYPRLQARTASEEELLRAHAREMVSSILSARNQSGFWDADTYYCPDSVQAALLAAGGTIDLATRIWKGELRRGFSLVRPPGHHATPQRAMGFCLFNNIALAAQAVLTESPRARLAIVDFDLHHGNGTQDLFYQNPNVLFLSSHRYPYYPGSGALDEVGLGKGKGTTLNFPLGSAVGRNVFIPLYAGLIPQILRDFKPEMIFVSAGFDGHVEDPMQGFALNTSDYGQIADYLIGSAEETSGKILFVLEGGYNPTALKDSVEIVLRKLAEASREAKRFPFGDSPLIDPFIRQAKAFFRI